MNSGRKIIDIKTNLKRILVIWAQYAIYNVLLLIPATGLYLILIYLIAYSLKSQGNTYKFFLIIITLIMYCVASIYIFWFIIEKKYENFRILLISNKIFKHGKEVKSTERINITFKIASIMWLKYNAINLLLSAIYALLIFLIKRLLNTDFDFNPSLKAVLSISYTLFVSYITMIFLFTMGVGKYRLIIRDNLKEQRS